MSLVNWLDKHLIPNWRQSWRMYSVQFSFAVGAAVAAFPALFVELANLLIEDPIYRAMAILAIIAIILIRLWDQEDRDEQDNGIDGK